MDLAPKVETGALWIACLLKQYKMNIFAKSFSWETHCAIMQKRDLFSIGQLYLIRSDIRGAISRDCRGEAQEGRQNIRDNSWPQSLQPDPKGVLLHTLQGWALLFRIVPPALP